MPPWEGNERWKDGDVGDFAAVCLAQSSLARERRQWRECDVTHGTLADLFFCVCLIASSLEVLVSLEMRNHRPLCVSSVLFIILIISFWGAVSQLLGRVMKRGVSQRSMRIQLLRFRHLLLPLSLSLSLCIPDPILVGICLT